MKSRNKHARKDLADIALTAKSKRNENCGEKCVKNMTECRIFHFRFLLLALVLGGGLIFASCNKSTEKHVARGEEYLQKRRFEEAVMEFRTAADIDKTSAKAHWGLARAYENLGQFYESIDALRQVTELDANNLEAKVKLGNYFLLSNPPQIPETERLLEDIFARDPNFIEGFVLKASLFRAQQKPEKVVLEVLNNAIALNPNRTETYLSLARFFIKTNKVNEAEKAIQKGISVNPNAAVGYLEYGRFLDFTNRAGDAEAQFKKAVEVEPKSIEAGQSIAEFYLAQRQLDKAEQSYKNLVLIQENSAEGKMDLANFYAQVGRADDAVKIFGEILQEKPEYVRARYRLCEIYLERKENARATEQIEELLKINDKDEEALMLRARVSMQENKAEESIKDLEEVLKKKPTQRNALFYMTQARLALGQIDQARAFIGDLEKYHPNFLKTKLLKIQVSFANDESENALREANELLDAIKNAYPSAENAAQTLEDLRIRALTASGLAYLQLEKLEQARADLQTVQRFSPNSSGALVNLAKVAVAENNLTEAAGLYQKALAADDKNFDALSGAVNVLSRQKQFAEAHRKIDKAIQESTGQVAILPALHYLKSNVFTSENNEPSAEEELKRAMAIDDGYLPAFSAYASLLAMRNQTDAAIEEYKKVVAKKPSASVFTLIGTLEDARGNAFEAEKNYRKALEIEPTAPIAANNLAWLIAVNGGNLDEALQLAQMTVSRNQNVAGYHDTLGWVYHKKGLHAPAVEQLKKAVALDEIEARQTNSAVNPAYRQRLGTAMASAS
jgi:tetratricopeptide (TPR) repeat protein